MWLYIIQGIGFGFAAAAQPGPFQTYIISQSLARGWKKTLPTAFAPLISDGPIIVICLFVLSQVPGWFAQVLYIVGGSFILYLAYGAYRTWKAFDPGAPLPEAGAQQSILKAALTNLLNPNPYIYWTLVTGPILLKAWHESPIYGIGFLMGFYATLILGLSALIVIFGVAREIGPKVNRALLGISSIALFCFGLYQLWMGINS
jgi:threonine/homoserine/homoserine lactone efflux protein